MAVTQRQYDDMAKLARRRYDDADVTGRVARRRHGSHLVGDAVVALYQIHDAKLIQRHHLVTHVRRLCKHAGLREVLPVRPGHQVARSGKGGTPVRQVPAHMVRMQVR